MNILFSVVVPIYNVEQYLERCIESIINQTYKNIEILLVNDGSKDNSYKIIEKYEKIDTRIKTINKENGGLSDARNFGINASTGEYIVLLDSDDYIEINSIELFYKSIKNEKPDILVNKVNVLNGDVKSKIAHRIQPGIVFTGQEFLKQSLSTGGFSMVAVRNIYKKEFLTQNKLEFKKGILHEDEEFTPRAMLSGKSVIGTDIYFYNYIIRENSITTTKNKDKNAVDMIQTLKELEIIYNKIDDAQLKAMLMNDLVAKYLNTFQVCMLYKPKYKHLIDKDFIKNKATTRKNKLKVVLFLFSKNLYYFVNYISKKGG